MKKKITIFIVLTFLLQNICFAADYPQRFYDVPKGYWAFEQIAELVNRGAISGYEDGSFKPDDIVTRAEWATIMIKAANKNLGDDVPSFTDMSGHWANPYVNASKQYMTSYAGGAEFRPDIAALREDVTVAMVKLKGYSVDNVDFSYIAKFNDQDSISANCKKYVAVAVEKGLISGFEDNTFRGQNTLSRAEAATLLWRAFQKGNDDKVVDDVDVQTTQKSTQKSVVKEDVKTQMEDTLSTIKEEPKQSEDNKLKSSMQEIYQGEIHEVYPISDTEAYILGPSGIKFYDGSSVSTILSKSKFPTELEFNGDYYQFSKYDYTWGTYYTTGRNLSATINLYLINTLSTECDVTISPDGNITFNAIHVATTADPSGTKKFKSPREFEQKFFEEFGYTEGTKIIKPENDFFIYAPLRNKIYSIDKITGGWKEQSVDLGLPSTKKLGSANAGFGIFGDNNFYVLNTDGTWVEAYNPSTYNLVIDGDFIYNDISSFAMQGKTYWIISEDRNHLRKLTVDVSGLLN